MLVIAFEFCERFGFYSMLSLFALFLAASRAEGGFGWDKGSALSVLGVYSGLMYALPVAGGWVADRLLGHRRAIAVGGGLMCAGYLLLTSPVLAPRLLEALGHAGLASRLAATAEPLGHWHAPAGLAPGLGQAYGLVSAGFWAAIVCLVLGNALMKATLVIVLGDALAGDSRRREAAYAYYYAGINLGGLVAGVTAGAVAVRYGWAAAFSVSALVMGLALAGYLVLGRRLLAPRAPAAAARRSATIEVVEDTRAVRARLVILAAFASLLFLYSVGSFQLWGAMSLFLEQEVDRRVGGFEIPTQWFTSVNAAALIVAGPCFAALWAALARRGREPSMVGKYALALALGAAGLLLFAAAAWSHTGGGKPGWGLPAIGIAVQAAGEVAAWTSTYGLVYRLAPRRMLAGIMGAYYAATLGLGGYMAGRLGALAEPLGAGRFFLFLGLATALAAVFALIVRRRLLAMATNAGAALSA